MNFGEIILIGFCLGMDSFAVAICKGLAMKKINWNKSLIIGIYFGMFQAIMPIIGYLLGIKFQSFIVSIDHWIAFVLLGSIGVNMLKESSSNNNNNFDSCVDVKTMLILAIATSIDALAVGITFAFLKVKIFIAATITGVIAFSLSNLGVLIGNKFGNKHEKFAGFLGGSILILMGLKILIEHLLID